MLLADSENLLDRAACDGGACKTLISNSGSANRARAERTVGPLPYCPYGAYGSPQAAGKSSGRTSTDTVAPRSPSNIILCEHPVRVSLIMQCQGVSAMAVPSSVPGIQPPLDEFLCNAGGPCYWDQEWSGQGRKLPCQT